MKIKKILSAIAALSIAVTTFASFNVAEASLGGKVTVTASLKEYVKMSDTAAFLYVDITMDSTDAEKYEVYSSDFDFATMANVTKGNGISTMGISLDGPGFTYVPSYSTKPEYVGINSDGTSIYISPIGEKADYVLDNVIKVTLAYAVTNLDASSEIKITGASLNGTNAAENNTVWAYHTDDNNIIATGCSIPSYNEWANPTPSKTEVSAETTAQAGHTDAANNTAFAYYVKLGADASQKTGYWTAKFDGTAYKHNQTFEVPTISGEGTANYGLIYKGDKTISEVKFVLE